MQSFNASSKKESKSQIFIERRIANDLLMKQSYMYTLYIYSDTSICHFYRCLLYCSGNAARYSSAFSSYSYKPLLQNLSLTLVCDIRWIKSRKRPNNGSNLLGPNGGSITLQPSARMRIEGAAIWLFCARVNSITKGYSGLPQGCSFNVENSHRQHLLLD